MRWKASLLFNTFDKWKKRRLRDVKDIWPASGAPQLLPSLGSNTNCQQEWGYSKRYHNLPWKKCSIFSKIYKRKLFFRSSQRPAVILAIPLKLAWVEIQNKISKRIIFYNHLLHAPQPLPSLPCTHIYNCHPALRKKRKVFQKEKKKSLFLVAMNPQSGLPGEPPPRGWKRQPLRRQVSHFIASAPK